MKNKKGSYNKLGSCHMFASKNTGEENAGLEIFFCYRLPVEFIELIHPRGNFCQSEGHGPFSFILKELINLLSSPPLRTSLFYSPSSFLLHQRKNQGDRQFRKIVACPDFVINKN